MGLLSPAPATAMAARFLRALNFSDTTDHVHKASLESGLLAVPAVTQFDGNAQEGRGFYITDKEDKAKFFAEIATHNHNSGKKKRGIFSFCRNKPKSQILCEVYATNSQAFHSAQKVWNNGLRDGTHSQPTEATMRQYVAYVNQNHQPIHDPSGTSIESINPIVFSNIDDGGANQMVLRQHHLKDLGVVAKCFTQKEENMMQDRFLNYQSWSMTHIMDERQRNANRH
ncbi:hypothetical protein HK405_006886 [Cladochytrium tenue]|nr:hypothetical protein HK405_006886 [Cladochytrium tenue]